MVLNEELELIKHEGNRIIRDKVEPFRRENDYLRHQLYRAGLLAP